MPGARFRAHDDGNNQGTGPHKAVNLSCRMDLANWPLSCESTTKAKDT